MCKFDGPYVISSLSWYQWRKRAEFSLVSEEGKGEIQLTSEDYLQGVIGMVNELVSRLPFYPTDSQRVIHF
jgi:hypothetical protein